MSDEWSLKDKKWETQPNSFGEVSQRLKDDGEYECDCIEYYYDEYDIETLRKKLIEDFESTINYLGKKQSYDDSSYIEISILEMKKIINKRFGVVK